MRSGSAWFRAARGCSRSRRCGGWREDGGSKSTSEFNKATYIARLVEGDHRRPAVCHRLHSHKPSCIFTTTMMIGDGIGNQQSAQGRAKLLIIYTHFIAGLD